MCMYVYGPTCNCGIALKVICIEILCCVMGGYCEITVFYNIPCMLPFSLNL